MITLGKITYIFCALNEFSKNFDAEAAKGELISSTGSRRWHREASLSNSEIMTILIMFYFGTFANFKHYYLHYIKIHLRREFPMHQAYIIEYQWLFILKGTSRILTIERSQKESVRCLHSMAFVYGLVPLFSVFL